MDSDTNQNTESREIKVHRFPNLHIRKTIALIAILVLVFATVWSFIMGEKDYILMLIPFWIGIPNWYFSKSTALDQPKSTNVTGT